MNLSIDISNVTVIRYTDSILDMRRPCGFASAGWLNLQQNVECGLEWAVQWFHAVNNSRQSTIDTRRLSTMALDDTEETAADDVTAIETRD